MATNEEIAQHEQFPLLSPCTQLYSIIVLSFKGSFQIFSVMFSKSSAADLLYVGKRLSQYFKIIQCILMQLTHAITKQYWCTQVHYNELCT